MENIDEKIAKEYESLSIDELKSDYRAGKNVSLCKNCKGVVQQWETFCDLNCFKECMENR